MQNNYICVIAAQHDRTSCSQNAAKNPHVLANIMSGLLTLQSTVVVGIEKNNLYVYPKGQKQNQPVFSENELLRLDPNILSDLNSTRKEINTRGLHGSILVEEIDKYFPKQQELSVGLPHNKYNKARDKWEHSLNMSQEEKQVSDFAISSDEEPSYDNTSNTSSFPEESTSGSEF